LVELWYPAPLPGDGTESRYALLGVFDAAIAVASSLGTTE
jgi:hypothetical protein